MSDRHENVPEIDPAEIEFDRKIGEGSYGYVYAGRCRGKDVAIKVFKHKKDLPEAELEAFREEVKIMSKIYHPNVVLFMGACTLGKELMIVTELLPTDLETLLVKSENNNFSSYEKIKMAKDAALGMNWLHCSNPVFIHRDLKLSNLLVDNNKKVCVCDFGLAQMKPRDVRSLEYDPHGSPLYMAPEVFVGDYNEKCDVYSFGIVLWEIYTQKQAFADLSDDLPSFIRAVCHNGFRPEIPPDTPPSISQLLQKCWAKDPEERPSFAEIINLLDSIMVDVAINDEAGRQLWKHNFLGKEEVTWDDFKKVIYRYASKTDNKVTDIKLKCLEVLLTEQSKKLMGNKNVVNLEKFGKLLAWFGPLVPPKGSNVTPMLSKVHTILRSEWFHGDINNQEAEDRLNGQKYGCFLIRFSSVAGCFTISSQSKEKRVIHQRIAHVPGEGFHFWNKKYETLQDLIDKEKTKFKFKTPCPGSKYQYLFNTEKKQPLPQHGYVIPT
mmetsp:Transcript_28558/g.71798  ORF Transcript_28558/g.71798 Transcript_28558/m.71798 type:complete len:494 (-) Transcript_28558:138-1619(-)